VRQHRWVASELTCTGSSLKFTLQEEGMGKELARLDGPAASHGRSRAGYGKLWISSSGDHFIESEWIGVVIASALVMPDGIRGEWQLNEGFVLIILHPVALIVPSLYSVILVTPTPIHLSCEYSGNN